MAYEKRVIQVKLPDEPEKRDDAFKKLMRFGWADRNMSQDADDQVDLHIFPEDFRRTVAQVLRISGAVLSGDILDEYKQRRQLVTIVNESKDNSAYIELFQVIKKLFEEFRNSQQMPEPENDVIFLGDDERIEVQIWGLEDSIPAILGFLSNLQKDYPDLFTIESSKG